MTVKYKKNGFTVVELLTVLAIIALLTSLLIPAVSMVRNLARNTRQRVQINNIDMALLAFRNDQGYYPPSIWRPTPTPENYCGAQKLAEALVGLDLLGFHPDSGWTANGTNRYPYFYQGTGITYPPGEFTFYGPGRMDDLSRRRGRYLELEVANAFRLGNVPAQNKFGLFENTLALEPDTFVLCDTFGWRKIPVGDQISNAGMPILYYRANTSSKTINTSFGLENSIYNANDNILMTFLRRKDDHPLSILNNLYTTEWGILDPQASAASGIDWPYRPDSYILISAGPDGLYGTGDDITNFGN